MSHSLKTCCICGIKHDSDIGGHVIIHRPNDQRRDDYYICTECYDKIDVQDPIREYGYKPRPMFYGSDNDLYMGVELEADNGKKDWLAAARITRFKEFYVKHDGSLGRNGIEIVSHPGTLNAHRSNMLHWKEVISILKSQYYRSHKTKTCGLHVHVNRSFFGETPEEIDLNVSKVILLTQRFWDGCIVPFSRRNLARLQHWAKKPEFKFRNGTDPNIISEEQKNTMSRDHYNGVNIMPRDTIEFRMFRGTLNYNTLIATLEFVYLFCHFAKCIDINDIDSTHWNDIFDGVDREEFKSLFMYLETRTKIDQNAFEDVFFRPTSEIQETEPDDRQNSGSNPDVEDVTSERCRDIRVGSLVQIREWDDMADEFGVDIFGNIDCLYLFTNEMRFLCGAIAKVESITYGSYGTNIELRFYTPELNDRAFPYLFSTDMVRPVFEEVVDHV